MYHGELSENELKIVRGDIQPISLPKIGDKIYIPTSLYLGHGRDDFRGGLATVDDSYEDISGGEKVHFIGIKERPGHGYNWDQYVAPNQEIWKKEYEGRIAHPDPDMDPQFNED